ncbi:MAG: hypothetical protein II000_03245 [Clostridia bacterium]|nr:hypothetical protein [Clostridia bacterium]
MLIEIAEVPFEVRCRFADNRSFFRDYQTEKAPLFVIEATDEDLEKMELEARLLAQRRGWPERSYGKDVLESYAVLLKLAKKMVFQNILMIHGSALCMDGNAYIFTASSGTGKSTHARLWRETFGDRVWMINDDQPMVRIGNDQVTVYGTPWDGKHHLSRNASAPLKAIAWLRRSKNDCIQPLTKAEAFPALLNQTVWSRGDPETMSKVLELEAKLLSAVPFYRLGCTMNSNAARASWAGMNMDNSR